MKISLLGDKIKFETIKSINGHVDLMITYGSRTSEKNLKEKKRIINLSQFTHIDVFEDDGVIPINYTITFYYNPIEDYTSCIKINFTDKSKRDGVLEMIYPSQTIQSECKITDPDMLEDYNPP